MARGTSSLPRLCASLTMRSRSGPGPSVLAAITTNGLNRITLAELFAFRIARRAAIPKRERLFKGEYWRAASVPPTTLMESTPSSLGQLGSPAAAASASSLRQWNATAPAPTRELKMEHLQSADGSKILLGGSEPGGDHGAGGH